MQIGKQYRCAEQDLRCRRGVAGKGHKGELMGELTACLGKNVYSCEQTFSL